MRKTSYSFASLTLTMCLIFSSLTQVPVQAEEIVAGNNEQVKESPVVKEITESFDFEEGTAGFTSSMSGTTIENSDDKAYEGNKSLKITPNASSTEYEITKEFEQNQVGKKVSVWIYSDGVEGRCAVVRLSNGSVKLDEAGLSDDAQELYNGIWAYNARYRAFGKRWNSNTGKMEYLKKSDGSAYEFNMEGLGESGWKEIVIDCSVAGIVTFYCNDVKLGELKIWENEYADFKTLSIINYWSKKAAGDIYVDHITLTSVAPVPSNLVVDDMNNAFDWTYATGTKSFTEYEYSTDQGETWTTCSAKPQYIGNKSIEVGALWFRVKGPVDKQYTYDHVTNTEPFTYSNDLSLPMQDEVEINNFNILINVPPAGTKDPWTYEPELTISNEQSHSGLTSLKLVPSQKTYPNQVNNSANLYRIGREFEEVITDKVLTVWFYDDTENTNKAYKMIGIAMDDSDPDNISQSMLGFNNNASSSTYVIRSKCGAPTSDWNKWGNAGTRSAGWHCLQWDYKEEPGKCKVYVDGNYVRDYNAKGFNKFYIQDTWSHTSGIMSVEYYIDDISISDSREVINQTMPAPSNPVVDAKQHTFGFTPVAGMEELSSYEYSTDSGNTFTTCSVNPIQLEEMGYKVGQVLVRLKAVDGKEPGAVLRNNIEFLGPNFEMRESLQKLYDRASAFYQGDYEAEGWSGFEEALKIAKNALDQGSNLETGKAVLTQAIGNLVQKIPDEVKYSFENRDLGPFEVTAGTQDWGEYTNISALGKQALKLNTVDVDGKQIASVKYAWKEALTDEFISFYFRDTKVGSTKVKLIDSDTNNGIIFYGGSRSYYYQLIDHGVVSDAVNTSMRRNGDWYNLELNLGVDDGIYCTMDSRPWLNSKNLSKIDTIEITFENSTSFLTIDDFIIQKKNPIIKMSPDAQEVTLGYYDTYEMNINHMDIQAEKKYKTTDLITYVSDDPSIAAVTTEGSIEYVSPGKTKVTAVASSGQTAQIAVICEDKKVTDIAISDSDYNDAPNIVTSLTMKPGQKKIVNAILTPKGVTNRKVIWESDKPSVISVNNGELTALGEGIAKITAISQDGNKKTELTVTVEKEVSRASIQMYVSKSGDDFTGDGSKEKPFATIERARDEVRSLCGYIGTGVDISLAEGNYTVLKGIVFDEQDSGTKNAPIRYLAAEGENVSLSGAISLNSKDFVKVTDDNILKKLPELSRNQVYVYDLSNLIKSHKDLQYMGHSISNMTWLADEGKNIKNPYYSVNFDNRAMTLSRWPNEGQNVYSNSYLGYTKIDTIVRQGAVPRFWLNDIIGRPDWIKPEDRDRTDSFEIQSKALTDRMKNWYGIPQDGNDEENILDEDIWMVGYWSADFSDQSAQVRWINNGTVKSDVPSSYGVKTNSFNRFYVYNLIQELDVPGEWYFDQKDYKLYIYPPAGMNMEDNHTISMAALEDTMLTFEESSDITFSGINLTGVLGHAVEMLGCSNTVVENAKITATELQTARIADSRSGKPAMNSGFDQCEIRDVNGGIILEGGNFNTLEGQGNYINNCHFSNYATVNRSYNPAVSLGGVGNRVSSCKIENGPHNAIMYYGNDQIIEFTEITDVVKEAKDQAAIYTGRNVLQRGTVIRNCYIHDIPRGSGNANSAIYLDDLTAGAEIIDNRFENMGWGLFMNGGRDNFMVDNEFTNCGDCIIINDWGYTGVNNWNIHGYGTIAHPLTMVPTTVAWSDKNSPYGKYEHLWCIREDNPWHSKYNKFIGNSLTGKGTMIYYMSRGVQANYKDVLNDWYFIKDNQ